MAKSKKPAAAKPAAKKRGRAAAAKTTKKSKAPSSVCPYARAEFNIEGSNEEPRWVGWHKEKMYSGEHPARSTPDCGKLLQFKVPRKWLDLSVEDFEAYNFWFTLHLKSGGRVSTRLRVLNEQGELKELLPSGLRAFHGESRSGYPEEEWGGDASTVRVAYRRSPRHSRRYQVKFLEASLQLGADGRVPESEFGPAPGEEGYDSDSGDESGEVEHVITVDGIPYDEWMAQRGCDPTTGQRLGEAQGV